jgi:uridine kinase
MTDETAKYGRKWQEKLTAMALIRARQGIFPREFGIRPDPEQGEAPKKEGEPPKTGAEALKTEGEVFKTIAEAIVARATEHRGTGPVIVLLGGGGAAGKSTFRKKIEEIITGELEKCQGGSTWTNPVQKLDLDQYFYPIELIEHRAADGKYDNPLNSDLLRARKNIESLKAGHEIRIPVHDRDKHSLAKQAFREAPELRNARVVIVEGLYSLGPCLRDLGDVAIYVHAAPVDRAKGRIWRDINVRNRPEEHVIAMLLGRETYHQTFVEPTQIVADYVVRRSSTSGTIAVVDGAVTKRCIAEAGKHIGLRKEQIVALWRSFTNEQKKHVEKEKKKTEF